MLGIYNYTVILTYVSMLVSILGVSFATSGCFAEGLVCLLVSGLLDTFDGKIASTKKDRTADEKRFGIQIDSLSDLVCFGFLPAMLAYQWVIRSSLSRPIGWITLAVCGLYVLAALIRLAWFNVDEENRQDRMAVPGERELYYGLPVTTSALIIPSAFLISFLLRDGAAGGLIPPCVLFVMAFAFLIPFKLKKPAMFGKLFMAALGLALLVLVLLVLRT